MSDLVRFLLVSDDPRGRSARADLARIWAISAIVGVLVFVFVPVTFLGGGNSYLRFAKVMASQLFDDTDTYFRTPGYPILMILTGVLRFDSFFGLMLAQTAMGIVIPVMIYRIVALYSLQTAYYTALLSIASMVPYGYAKSVLAEQMYIFVLILAMYFSARIWSLGRARDVYAMTAVLFVLPTVKPVGAYLLAPMAVIAFVFLRRSQRRLVTALAIAVALFIALWPVATMLRNQAIRNPRMAVTSLNTAGAIGKTLFYNVYLTGGHLNNDVLRSGSTLDQAPPFMSDATGPAVRQMREILERVLTQEYVARTAGTLAEPPDVRDFFYGRFAGRPDALVAEMLRAPSLTYYWYMWTVLDETLGPQESDRLFLQVSLELLRQRPLIAMNYIVRNVYFFAIGVSIDYIYALYPNYNVKTTQTNLNGLVGYTPTRPESEVLTPALRGELKTLPGGEWNTRIRMLLFYHLWTPLFLVWRPLVFVGMCLGPFLLLRTRVAPLAWLGAVVVIYHMFVVCVFMMPIDRYLTETILVELMVAVPAWVEGLRRLAGAGSALRTAAG